MKPSYSLSIKASLIILLTGGFRSCFTELTAKTLTTVNIQGKLSRTSTPGVIQKEDQELMWQLDKEDDNSEQEYDSEHDDFNTEAMYREDLFEGDIVLASNDATVFNRGVSMTWYGAGCIKRSNSCIPQIEMNAIHHNAVRQKTLLWPKGRVPYVISPVYSDISKLIILEAFKEYQLLTCIRFTPKGRFDNDYIHIAPYDGCYSMVGNNGGKQTVSLGDGCLKKGIVIHELMHVIGFFHEQNRADRDLYVDILWENVKSTVFDQFDKYSPTMIDNLGSPYDYDSVTHYSAVAFSKNGKPTIIPKFTSKEMAVTSISNVEKPKNEKQRKELEISSTIRGKIPTTIRTVLTVPSTSSTSNVTPRTKETSGFKFNLYFSTLSTLPSPFVSTHVNVNGSSNLFSVVKNNVTGPITSTVAIPTTTTSIALRKMQYCSDRFPYCQTLRTRDFCSAYSRFVQDYCALSCGKC